MKQKVILDIGEQVYLVFCAKRTGAKKNIVILCSVSKIVIQKNSITYDLTPVKIVTDKKESLDKYITYFWADNNDINKGTRSSTFVYPIFTDKQKCIEWLKGVW